MHRLRPQRSGGVLQHLQPSADDRRDKADMKDGIGVVGMGGGCRYRSAKASYETTKCTLSLCLTKQRGSMLRMIDDQPIHECPVSLHTLTQPAVLRPFGPDGRNWPGWQFDCSHCGAFIVDQIEYSHLLGYLNADKVPGVAQTPLQSKRQRSVMAHALRRMAASGKTPVLMDGMTLRILKEDRLPNLTEQRDNLLRWFGTVGEIGPSHLFGYDGLGARVGSASPGAFQLLLESMAADGFIRGKLGAGADGEFKLGYRGLERLEQLERATPSGYNAFMAMKFGDAALNRIVDDYFRQAVRDTGFELFRLDDKPEAGLIDARLRNEIRNCRFLIADLSHANLGAYWEAGYAEGIGKPVIYTCEKSVFEGKVADTARPHFDTNHHLTIVWDGSDPIKAARYLKETIRFTIPEARQEISVT
jgi:hypothetical protein